jgi:aminoglycoside phosphotransferase (APT) family kinase protein
VNLPDVTEVSTEALHAIAGRHGLGVNTFSILPSVGIFNTIYLLGTELVLRVPRNHPNAFACLRKESVAVPAARRAGVRTPALLFFDDTRELLPVPYAIFERVHGETLGLLDLEPCNAAAAYRELGCDLALLHAGVSRSDAAGQLGSYELPDPRHEANELAVEGYFTSAEARWLTGWLERLAPAALASLPPCFLHGDTQATNMIVCPDSREYVALIDWGDARWGDAAFDFIGMPLRAVPFALEGHRAVAPLDDDETAEARILWHHLLLALLHLRRPPQPERSWAERPASMLIEIARFFLETPGLRWREWTPPL